MDPITFIKFQTTSLTQSTTLPTTKHQGNFMWKSQSSLSATMAFILTRPTSALTTIPNFLDTTKSSSPHVYFGRHKTRKSRSSLSLITHSAPKRHDSRDTHGTKNWIVKRIERHRFPFPFCHSDWFVSAVKRDACNYEVSSERHLGGRYVSMT